MATRTRRGHLELTDTRDPDRRLIIIPQPAGITLLVVNRDADTQAEILLSSTTLDELATEILRIREERGI